MSPSRCRRAPALALAAAAALALPSAAAAMPAGPDPIPTELSGLRSAQSRLPARAVLQNTDAVRDDSGGDATLALVLAAGGALAALALGPGRRERASR